jgi:phosphoribosylamine--glycine ligase
MMTARGPMVLEFNCRFGDPETQAVLYRLESDLLEVCESVTRGALAADSLRWSPEPSVCIVLASGGYPGTFTSGRPIFGIDEAEKVSGVKVFHAGTAHSGDQIVSSGGRVLGVTARAPDLATATARAYEAAEKIRFEGMQYRKDIARTAVGVRQ